MADPELLAFTASDGYAWKYRRYAAAGTPRGRLVFVHGVRSHGGWYGRSCAEIAAAGYEVFFLDRRGAGLNVQARGDAPGYRRLLDDIAEFLAEKRKADGPLILGGISWGGKLAAALPARRPGLVDGLVLMCPGLCPKVSPPLGQRIAIAATRLWHPRRRFPIPLNDPELFTRSPEWQAFVRHDPHGLTEATARFMVTSAGLDVYLRRGVKRIDVPTLLLLAEHDGVIDNAATRRRLAVVPRLEVIEYPGAHHTLEFEPAGHPFVGDVLRWAALIPSPLGSAGGEG